MTRQPVTAALRDDVLPAVASRAVRDVLEGPLRTWERVGANEGLTWLIAGHEVLAIQADPAGLLPIGLVALGGGIGRMTTLAESGVVGQGYLDLGRTRLEVARWWDPVPRLEVVAPVEVAARLAEAAPLSPPVNDEGLGVALATAIPADIHRAGLALLGAGEGVTPEGDDVLVGALAALRLLGPAMRAPAAHRLLAELAGAVLAEAWVGTSAMAASLLRHGHAGAVAAPVGRLLHSLTGHGEVASAVAELLDLSAASGAATLHGVLIATGCLIGAPV